MVMQSGKGGVKKLLPATSIDNTFEFCIVWLTVISSSPTKNILEQNLRKINDLSCIQEQRTRWLAVELTGTREKWWWSMGGKNCGFCWKMRNFVAGTNKNGNGECLPDRDEP